MPPRTPDVGPRADRPVPPTPAPNAAPNPAAAARGWDVEVAALQTKLETDLRAAWGIPQGAAVPAELSKAIKIAVETAADRRVKAHLDRVANKEVAQKIAGSYDIKGTVASTAKFAFEAAQSIAANKDYLASLDETAKMTKARYDAYVKVGFSTAESFKLLEAEIYAKARLRPGA